MNLLQINTVCGIGSTGRIATDLCSILLSQGHCCTIAFGRDEALNCCDPIRIGNKLDNYFHVARTRVLDSHGFGSARSTAKLISRMKVLNPDIIHLHNLHGYYLHTGLLFDYLKQANKPIVWTLHDCWPFTGHCAHFDFVSCERWQCGCYDCPQKTGYPASLFLDRSQQNYTRKMATFKGVPNLTLVTPSQWLAALVKRSFLKDYPLTVINNGIDLDIFKPKISNFRQRFHLENHFLMLGIASIWGERKGFNYFLELAKQLRPNEKIVLVGLSAKQIKQLPPEIVGIVKTNSINELAEIYSAADLYLNPTLEDNFPTTNLEALACGTPVITFNSGGSPECLGDSCGLVVERGNMRALLDAIAAMKHAGKAAFLAQCRQRAEKYYDKNDRYADYINLYEKVLSC